LKGKEKGTLKGKGRVRVRVRRDKGKENDYIEIISY
jgi:hypothetical protein